MDGARGRNGCRAGRESGAGRARDAGWRLRSTPVSPVNAVSPRFTDTPAWHVTETGEQHLKRMSEVIPLARPGTTEEIATAVVFRASDGSSYVTGTELFVDGGFAQV